MTALEQALRDYGYVRCPNQPQRWYAGGPGLLEGKADVFVRESYIEVLPYWWQTSTPVALGTFDRPVDFFAWLQQHGQPSESGARHF